MLRRQRRGKNGKRSRGPCISLLSSFKGILSFSVRSGGFWSALLVSFVILLLALHKQPDRTVSLLHLDMRQTGVDRLRRDLHEAHAERVWFGAYIAESPVRHRLFRGDLNSEETAANNELLADAMRSVTALVSGAVQLGGVNICGVEW